MRGPTRDAIPMDGGGRPAGGPLDAPGPLGRLGNTVCLNADGSGGRDTYLSIEKVFGQGAIEAPDHDHSPPVRHVREDADTEVGPHFVFSLHRDIDRDREKTDRQRMEIKVFDRSQDLLKARAGSTFTYTWRFKLNARMALSKKFTHLFQLKGVGGDDKMPLVTLTGALKQGRPLLEARYMHGETTLALAQADWTTNTELWLEARCRATFGHRGALELDVVRPDGVAVLRVQRNELDLWRDGEFVRPKWGIYRSLDDAENLRAEEETVRFANFAVTNGARPDSDCR